MTFAAQELRLISSLVVLLALGLFLALPFVLSIGSVVFLPLVSRAHPDHHPVAAGRQAGARWLPNFLASHPRAAGVLRRACPGAERGARPGGFAVRRGAGDGATQVGRAFLPTCSRHFAWVARPERQSRGADRRRERAARSCWPGPTMLEQLAFATPTVVLEVLLTFLLAFFMIEARVRLRRRLLLDRQQVGASLKAARAIREVQDRVAAYILTVGLINLGRRHHRCAGRLGDGAGGADHVGRPGRAAQLPALCRAACRWSCCWRLFGIGIGRRGACRTDPGSSPISACTRSKRTWSRPPCWARASR